MLKTRLLTAVVLISVFLFALFFLPPSGWVIFVTVIAAIAAWEWGGLMRWDGRSRLILGGVFALICLFLSLWQPAPLGLKGEFAASAWHLGQWIYLPAAAFWLLLVPCWLRQRWPLPQGLPGLLAGLLLLLPAWLALIQLRQAGELVLLAIMATVWLADSAAYFVGRRFGRRKLAPSISPGKTWEGAMGAVVAVMIYGFVLVPTLLKLNPLLLLLLMGLLTAISIMGDLFESLLKRQAGLKDSSNILPGHGGILDRIDSLTSTLPMVALVWLLMR